MPSIIKKPYGQELLLTTPDLPYAAKIRYLGAGCRDSLQYHDQKIETVILVKGQANLYLGKNPRSLHKTSMVINQPYTIQPSIVHRHEAVTDSEIFEVSTPETGTTFRLEDDYHRPDETAKIRNSPNRGWSSDES